MSISKSLTLAAVAGLTLSGCVASRYQISDSLMRYGLSENQAGCAAEFLRGHLSTGQVSRLSKAARYYDKDGPLTLGDLIRVAGSMEDPEILLEVGAAAFACKLAADIPIGRM
jgi:hypothetical protein